MEAFTHLTLENNYFSWVHDFKKNCGTGTDGLMTEYDRNAGAGGYRSITCMLPEGFAKMEIKVPGREEDNLEGFVYLEEDDDNFELTKRMNNDTQKGACSKARRSELYLRSKNILQQLHDNDRENSSDDDGELLKKGNKRRKLLKELKGYTGNAQAGQRKFKGWSDDGHKALERLAALIRADVSVGIQRKWELSYLEMTERINKVNNEAGVMGENYEPDVDTMYELE